MERIKYDKENFYSKVNHAKALLNEVLEDIELYELNAEDKQFKTQLKEIKRATSKGYKLNGLTLVALGVIEKRIRHNTKPTISNSAKANDMARKLINIAKDLNKSQKESLNFLLKSI